MEDLEVSSLTVPQLLTRLYSGVYQVPIFQREFVWQVNEVSALAESVVRRRPIGMATLWSIAPQADSDLKMDPIQLNDLGGPRSFLGDSPAAPQAAILDGRQRCTALAMAFGGLAPKDNRYRGAGQFFLDLSAGEDDRWVVFKKQSQVDKEHLGAPAGALAKGLMPLSISPQKDWNLTAAWTKHMLTVANESIYESGHRPGRQENESRVARIERALDGLNAVRLATYTLGSSYNLSDICEIFETLNTTGVQVSTVDLIHSFVFQDTFASGEPVNIREWLDELGKIPGAIGWSSSTTKPERMAQIVTAAYVGLADKPPARQLKSAGDAKVSTIKAGDLLRTPSAHWKSMISDQDRVAELLGDFQVAAAGGPFPLALCPYPASAAVYMGLAWSKDRENLADDAEWSTGDLRSLFRAFFWRNALTGRYDQGFLSQVGTDMNSLREILRKRAALGIGEWLKYADGELGRMIVRPLPDLDMIKAWCLNGKESGAIRDSVRLLLWTQTRKDLVETTELPPPGADGVELHHIWPKKWINSNKTGDLELYLKEAQDAQQDRVNCPANLVPLSATSNKKWRDKNPGQILVEKDVHYATHKDLLDAAFIDEPCFTLLMDGKGDDVRPFHERRAALIAEAIQRRTTLYV